MKACKIAAALEARGIGHKAVTEADEFENLDGEVEVTDAVSVQCGRGYLIVVRVDAEDNFYFGATRRTAELDLVAADVREAVKLSEGRAQ